MSAVIYTSWANVITIAPMLNAGPPSIPIDFTTPSGIANQNLFLQDAANLFQFTKYGALVEEIQRYATAHKAYLAIQPGGGTGPIQNETIGGISVSYVPVAPRALKPWTETQYGRRVLQIIAQSMPRIRFVSPPRQMTLPNQ